MARDGSGAVARIALIKGLKLQGPRTRSLNQSQIQILGEFPTMNTKASKTTAAEIKPSRSVMVRSLRRRLWKALQEEDVATAVRAYTATKSDYDQWLDEELFDQEGPRSGDVDKKDPNQKVSHGSRRTHAQFWDYSNKCSGAP